MSDDEFGPEIRYMQWLAEQEFDDAHTLRRETAAGLDIPGGLVMEILDGLAAAGGELQRDELSERFGLDTDWELTALFEASIVELEDDTVRLKHDYVFVKPLVFDGEVLRDD